MKTKSGGAMYAGVSKAFELYGQGEPGQRRLLTMFLEDMHALSFLENKVRNLLENEDSQDEVVEDL